LQQKQQNVAEKAIKWGKKAVKQRSKAVKRAEKSPCRTVTKRGKTRL